MDATRQRVLNALLAQTISPEEWTSERALRTVVCAHGSLSPAEFEKAAFDLAQRDLVEYGDGQFRPTPAAKRVPYAGEVT